VIRSFLVSLLARPELQKLSKLEAQNKRLIQNAELQVTELIPSLMWDEDGKLTPASEASIAVKAISQCEISGKLEAMELLYQQYAAVENFEDAAAAARNQVCELARGFQELMTRQAVETVQSSIGSEHGRISEDLRNFRRFLKEHFEKDMDVAESLNRPLLDVAKELLLKVRV